MTAGVQDRTELVAHYVVTRARPDKLGSVKLNKVLWFADLEAYRRLGKTITRQRSYEKRQFGPVPNNIVTAMRSLCYDEKVLARQAPTPAGDRSEFIWLQRPDISSFAPEEIDILNEAIDWVCDKHSAKSISELSHDALWDEIELGEQIPIGAASVQPGEITHDDIAWALDGLATADA